MPKKIQNFAKSALVKPITINVGRAGAASLDVIQVNALCTHREKNKNNRTTPVLENHTFVQGSVFAALEVNFKSHNRMKKPDQL